MPEDVPLNEDNSSLEKLRTRLYATEAPPAFQEPQLPPTPTYTPPPAYNPSTGMGVIPPSVTGARQAWAPPPPPKPKKKISWTVFFLIGAVIFFLLAAGTAFFFVQLGGNAVSSNNITITVQGPTSIASGTTVPLVITIKNNNPAAITQPDITLTFPDGTRSATDVTQPLLRYADTLGTIAPGGTATVNVQAVLFGSVNQGGTIPINFQYNTSGSNTLFTKQQNYTYTITSSPLSITSQSISSVSSGQPFTIQVAVRSNATASLANIGVSAVYPTGFTMQKFTLVGQKNPNLSNTSNTGFFLPLGTLSPGEEKDFTITGILSGTQNTQNAFQFTVGTQAVGMSVISVPYASQSSNITITQPFLSPTLALNHDSTNPTVVKSGEPISGMLSWVNTLTSGITNAQITIQLSGNALDPSSMTTQNGYYNSAKNELLFTPQTESSLANLAPGDTGNGTFSFMTKSGAALNALRNPTVTLNVSVSGQPAGGAPQTLTNSVTNTVQVQTDLELASRIVRSIGPFKNSGAWPPVVNQPTTYTVQLAVTNTVNTVGSAKATMILPEYVTFTGQMSPNDGSISYDSTSHTVTWNIGDVAAGTTANNAKNASFQISYTPSVTQVGQSPILVGNQTLVGGDRFTGTQVGNTAPALTTQASADPAYQPQFGTVAN